MVARTGVLPNFAEVVLDVTGNRGIFCIFFLLCTVFNIATSTAPQILPFRTEDAGIEPRTVATQALKVHKREKFFVSDFEFFTIL